MTPTSRELAALRAVVELASYRAAAVSLEIAPDTIRAHVRHAREKLGARNTAHAVAIALRSGLIE